VKEHCYKPDGGHNIQLLISAIFQQQAHWVVITAHVMPPKTGGCAVRTATPLPSPWQLCAQLLLLLPVLLLAGQVHC
jgi:hypothetical protein